MAYQHEAWMDQMDENKLAPLPETVTLEKVAEFLRLIVPKQLHDVYANNARFESSVWDLRIVLGSLDQTPGKPATTNYHTSVTLPWPQVKLSAYYLLLNVAWQEILNGPVTVPRSVMPTVDPPTGEAATDPNQLAFYEITKTIYAQIFGE